MVATERKSELVKHFRRVGFVSDFILGKSRAHQRSSRDGRKLRRSSFQPKPSRRCAGIFLFAKFSWNRPSERQIVNVYTRKNLYRNSPPPKQSFETDYQNLFVDSLERKLENIQHVPVECGNERTNGWMNGLMCKWPTALSSTCETSVALPLELSTSLSSC